MLVLAMDTATPVTSVAVGSDAGTLAAVAVRHERRHAELLTPAVRWVLEQTEVDPGSLGGVAVGTGPGLFTGLRVGVSTAKALAQAWHLPMVAVPSLDLLAFAHRHVHRTICPVIDARRGGCLPLDVTPLYLRRPDVDPSIERRLAAERTAGGSGASSVGPRSAGG